LRGQNIANDQVKKTVQIILRQGHAAVHIRLTQGDVGLRYNPARQLGIA
jgi:hypothetical protein